MKINKSFYPLRKLDSVASLAKFLGIKPAILIKIAINSSKYYKPNAPKYKCDGSVRQTYTVLQPLNTILRRIKQRILDRVEYANFLFGGIRARKGIKGNAEQLIVRGSPIALLKFDIKNFFPSVTCMQVQNIWINFFKFSEDVSEILSKLVTLDGMLPQGAHTSNDLANLVFWEDEHNVAVNLLECEVVYTRYVDDVSLAVNRSYTKQDLRNMVSLIFSFFYRYGFKLRRKKLEIITTAQPMIVNKSIVINNGYNTPSKSKINKAKNKLYELSNNINHLETDILKKETQSLRGYIRHLLYIKDSQVCRKMLDDTNILLNRIQ